MQRINVKKIVSILLIATAARPSLAQTPSGEGNPHGPPAEALAACKSLSTGAECSFTNDRGAVTGTCWAPEGKPLACKPADAPRGSAAPPSRP